MAEERITLAHGNGGRLMRELIEGVFARHLHHADLDVQSDAAPFALDGGTPYVSTDGFTVQPLFFPGGSIGALAVHGTVNDLAVAGATPRYLTVNAFIEEGLALADLDRLVADLAAAAREAGVSILAGDTKVVPRGEGSGLYLATTGIGVRPAGVELGLERVRPGDAVLVSGPVGDHGTAVMLAREQFGLRGDLVSDAASVQGLAEAVRALPGLRFLRDPTRGGLATVAHEIAQARTATVRLLEAKVPVRDPVQAVCEMLGYDPYYLACEGRVVAVAAPEAAGSVLAAWRDLPEGAEAAEIGRIEEGPAEVVLETELGGERVLEELEDDPLPRIC